MTLWLSVLRLAPSRPLRAITAFDPASAARSAKTHPELDEREAGADVPPIVPPMRDRTTLPLFDSRTIATCRADWSTEASFGFLPINVSTGMTRACARISTHIRLSTSTLPAIRVWPLPQSAQRQRPEAPDLPSAHVFADLNAGDQFMSIIGQRECSAIQKSAYRHTCHVWRSRRGDRHNTGPELYAVGGLAATVWVWRIYTACICRLCSIDVPLTSAQAGVDRMTSPEPRRCAQCRTPLARDNRGPWCSACTTATELRQQPPTLPAPFWDHVTLRAAAQQRHMGKLIAAYRRHPHHGRTIAQGTIAAWAGLTQAQVSRLESGRPERHLDRLAFWANLLHIPPALRWFDTPDPPISRDHSDVDQPNGPTGTRNSDDSEPNTSIFDAIEMIEHRRSLAIATDVDEVVLAHIEAEIRNIVAVYEQHSPLELAPRIRNLRTRVLSLLDERQLPRQRERLYAAAARLSGVHGVIAMDVGRFTVASHYGAEAFAFAEAIRQPDVQAWVRAGQSLIAYYSGRYDDALAFARDGLARSPHGPQAVRLAINGQARALARLGDSRGVDVAVEHGLAALPSGGSAVSPSLSLETYCEARAAANAATAYLLLGRHAEAKTHAHNSLAAFDRAELHGPRALSRLDLATAELQRPARELDLEYACANAVEALTLTTDQGFESVTLRTSEFLAKAEQWSGHAAVRQVAGLLEQRSPRAVSAIPSTS